MQTDFDELNQLNSPEIVSRMRSKDYEDYFGEMDITDEQKERRIELAEKLEDKILFVLSLIAVLSVYSSVDWNYIETEFQNAYFAVLGGSENIDSYVTSYVYNTSRALTQSSERNMGDEYNTSYDRARFISENDANAIINHDENYEAELEGYEYKTWHTMGDKKVRETHAEVDGETIPIYEQFEVGGYYMDYPMDESYGASAEEIVGCRCSIEYS